MKKKAVHPIARAVAPLRQGAIDAAEASAKKYLAGMRKQVVAQPDLNLLAPYPEYGKGTSIERRLQQGKRDRFTELTKRDPRHKEQYHLSWREQPQMVVWDKDAAAKYVDDVKASAGRDYDAYVDKLIFKVEGSGDTTREARVNSPSGVWTESYLVVDLASGAQQTWRTQMIWNTSVLGKIFAQYPTRLVLPKAKKGGK